MQSDLSATYRARDVPLFLCCRLFSTAAMQVQSVAVGWRIYEITHNPLSLGLVGLSPDEAHPGGRGHDRPRHCVSEPQPELTDGEQPAEDQQGPRPEVAPVRSMPSVVLTRRVRGGRPLRHHQPEGAVQGDARAPGQDEEGEGDAHGAHIDAVRGVWRWCA